MNTVITNSDLIDLETARNDDAFGEVLGAILMDLIEAGDAETAADARAIVDTYVRQNNNTNSPQALGGLDGLERAALFRGEAMHEFR
ncbi:hypothetical protein [Roseovarius mucosus]|uniref:hypothetical protein n=1 Tax=Roseovarius mucosus TaxID=215743 RepID=UPI003F71BE4B